MFLCYETLEKSGVLFFYAIFFIKIVVILNIYINFVETLKQTL